MEHSYQEELGNCKKEGNIASHTKMKGFPVKKAKGKGVWIQYVTFCVRNKGAKKIYIAKRINQTLRFVSYWG